MKICLDISPLVISKLTGVGNYTLNLCSQLMKDNPEDEFILFAFCPLAELKNIHNVELFKYPNIAKERIIPLPSKFAKTAFISWQKINFPPIEYFVGECDIYHNFDWYLPPVKKAKRFITIFDLTTILYPQFHKEANVKLQNLRMSRMKNTDYIVTISESGRRDLQKYKPELKNIEVIYPGCNSAFRITDTTENEKILLKYNLKKPFILTVSTLEPRKNLIRLIEAYSQIAENIEDELVIVGDIGWKNSELTKYKNSGLTHRIKFLKYVPLSELVNLYNSCHFFTYVSIYEGFGIPPLEAMRVGKNILISNTASLPEVGGDKARYVDPLSVENIRDSLCDMAKTLPQSEINVDLIQYSQKFSYANSAQQLHNWYQKALKC